MSFSRFSNGLFQSTGQFIAAADTKPFKDFAKRGELVIAGYATTYDIGLEGAVIARDALSEEDLKQRPTLLFNHDQNRPIGRVVRSKIDDKGLFIVGVIDSTEKEIQQKIMSGTLSRFSIRGRIMRSHAEWRKETQKNVDVIDELKTLEVSVVSVPAVAESEIQKWYLQRNFELKGGDSMGEQRDVEAKDITREDEAQDEYDEELVLEGDGTVELLLGLDERMNDLIERVDNFEAAANDLKAVIEKLNAIDKKIDEVLKKLKKYPYPYPYPAKKRDVEESADEKSEEEEAGNPFEEIQESIRRLADDLEELKRSPVVKGEKKGEKQQDELKRFVESDEYKTAAPTDKLRMLYDFLQKGGE